MGSVLRFFLLTRIAALKSKATYILTSYLLMSFCLTNLSYISPMKPKALRLLILLSVFSALPAAAQEILLPMNSMFKDAYILSTHGDSEIGFTGTGLLPATQGDINQIEYLGSDSTDRYKMVAPKIVSRAFCAGQRR
jgi:hypothetical protein